MKTILKLQNMPDSDGPLYSCHAPFAIINMCGNEIAREHETLRANQGAPCWISPIPKQGILKWSNGAKKQDVPQSISKIVLNLH